ncbi:hypothetical protein [Rhodococcus sp. T7]|uniref:hypothetical protein n=1 Tax=Rhodococcus sp. T7 TaxID=627444 RepID=UPI001359FBED|nr:hypothetical protein [Rhodococcus sp. T7]KAF0957827.1 hypothetical protein MLGJGCBP_09659 [Rhodococcus sp. T7]KAF0961520.1 hypothetical protein MLGJGCBP_05400 [Rhodococcus sp. T7]
MKRPTVKMYDAADIRQQERGAELSGFWTYTRPVALLSIRFTESSWDRSYRRRCRRRVLRLQWHPRWGRT